MNELMTLLYVFVICIMILITYWLVERRRYEKAREERRRRHLAHLANMRRMTDEY